ncbi:hypothetical protein KIN_17520 [Litoreibacter roseus]|uniref:Uncharacterized protein n=1 Tax=Litoreibacter roseus TaxID=2601869 RepID=A0A6N6JHB8_9RHOB|nr:hypothetical protein KIN_17520 [Litoreibacter roseus]
MVAWVVVVIDTDLFMHAGGIAGQGHNFAKLLDRAHNRIGIGVDPCHAVSTIRCNKRGFTDPKALRKVTITGIRRRGSMRTNVFGI